MLTMFGQALTIGLTYFLNYPTGNDGAGGQAGWGVLCGTRRKEVVLMGKKDPNKSPKETGGPVVKTGPTAGQNRSRNDDGSWRAKRSDAGTKKK